MRLSHRRLRSARADDRSFGSERGSALAAVPAMLLLTIAIGAFVLDEAAVFLAARQLDGVAQDVVRSAASGLSLATLYRSGDRALDPQVVERLAAGELSASRSTLGDLVGSPRLDIAVGSTTVCVTLRAVARRPIAPALLGKRLVEVKIQAHALAVLAPPGTRPDPESRLVSAC